MNDMNIKHYVTYSTGVTVHTWGRIQEHANEDLNSIIFFNEDKAGQDKAERQDTPGSHK